MGDERTAAVEKPAGSVRALSAALVGVIYFFPVIWMILAAFKTRPDALATPPKLFFTPTLEHFWASFHRLSADGSHPRDATIEDFDSIRHLLILNIARGWPCHRSRLRCEQQRQEAGQCRQCDAAGPDYHASCNAEGRQGRIRIHE